MLDINNTIYYGYYGQVYDIMPGGVMPYLTNSHQHQFRNEGVINMPQYRDSLNRKYDFDYSYNDYCNELSKYRDEPLCLYDPNKKPVINKKKKIFEDDDWSKPLYEPDTTISIRDTDTMDCDPEVMTMEECNEWLDKYGRRCTNNAVYYKSRIYKRMDELECKAREKKILEGKCSKFIRSFYKSGLPVGLCSELEHMFMHQDEWWSSKQIRKR